MTSLPRQNIHYRLARDHPRGAFFRPGIEGKPMNLQTSATAHGAAPPAVHFRPWVSTACERLHISPRHRLSHGRHRRGSRREDQAPLAGAG